MTQFAPKHLCEKLQAAGCVSESDDFYFEKQEGGPWSTFVSAYNKRYFKNDTADIFRGNAIQAFTLLDLIGPNEQARANAVKWWGGKNINGGPADFEFWEESRLHLVNVSYITSDAEAWEYVERTGRVENE